MKPPSSTVAHSIPLVPVVLGLCGLFAGATLLRQALRISRLLPGGRATARRTRAFVRPAPRTEARVLILGDSTAVGVGAARPEASLAGLLAEDLPQAEIVNLARSGATVADSLASLRAAPDPWAGGASFELVVVLAGGNDVLKLTPLARLRADARRLLDALGPDAARCVWLGPANLGLAPVFIAPFSWWLSARTHKVVALLRRETEAHGARFVNFCHARAHDPFSRDPALWFAADGLHPSETSYRWCYRQALRERVLKAQHSGSMPRWQEGDGRPLQPALGMRLAEQACG